METTAQAPSSKHREIPQNTPWQNTFGAFFRIKTNKLWPDKEDLFMKHKKVYRFQPNYEQNK